MKILILNAGSSSIKYCLFEMPAATVLAAGSVEKIGEPGSRIRVEAPLSAVCREEVEAADHRQALARIVRIITQESGPVSTTEEIAAVGHRVVHGGEHFSAPAVIDSSVTEAIRAAIPLAPLHNPANLLGIEAAAEIFPRAPQVAVFDTAFHQTMPPHAFLYALPRRLYHHYRLRRYGFHGTSHQSVAKQAARLLARPLNELNLISLHLGNGASAAAIAAGRSVDTSMGLTPLEGLVMGTRPGDFDPGIIFFLAESVGLPLPQIRELLNHHSGLKGLAGENDMRQLLGRKAAGDAEAALALDIYCCRIKKYVGAYFALLGSIHALLFTGGVGENAPEIRQEVCTGLEALGIRVDAERNFSVRGGPGEIQAPLSAVKILVLPAEEEREIAEQTWELVTGRKSD